MAYLIFVLLFCLCSSFQLVPLNENEGLSSWLVEGGSVPGRFYSRRPHRMDWGLNPARSVVLGKGYLLSRTKIDVMKQDLMEAGVSMEHINHYVSAFGLVGKDADEFILKTSRSEHELTAQQEKILFDIQFKRAVSKLEMFLKKEGIDSSDITGKMREFLIDLSFADHLMDVWFHIGDKIKMKDFKSAVLIVLDRDLMINKVLVSPGRFSWHSILLKPYLDGTENRSIWRDL